MKNFALLAITILYLFIIPVNARKNWARSMIKEPEGEVKREELHLPLLAKIVPNVVNPPETLKPPAFTGIIYKHGEVLGSGSVLNQHHMITLCSLLKGDKDTIAKSLTIVLPAFNASHIIVGVNNISVSHVELHPDCGDTAVNPANDLGIIRTKEPMEHVTYPKLPTIHIPLNESKFIISNFRVFNRAATTRETVFWYIITRVVDNSICSILFEADHAKYSLEANLCMAYYHLGGADYCKSDIGSPLSIKYKDEDTLVGLNLHKHDCGHPKEAASFVCIRTNKEWIEKVLRS